MITKVLGGLCEASSQASSPLKSKGLTPGPLHSIDGSVHVVPEEVWSYPGNAVCIDPKEKAEEELGMRIGRRSLVRAAYSLLSTGRQNSVVAERAAASPRSL